MAELSPEDIQEILRIFSESELEELRLEVGGTRLHVSKASNGLAPAGPADPGPSSVAATSPASSPPAPAPAPATRAAPAAATSPAAAPPPVAPALAAPAAQPSPPSAEPAPAREGLYELRSPLLGVFYRRPSPDQPPFVEVGATVGPEDPVCIVDVMKMFTRVPAGTAGTIAEVLVEDGQLVEHGQVLMRIEPA